MSLSPHQYFIFQGFSSPKKLHPRGSWPRPSCTTFKTAREQKKMLQGLSWLRPRTLPTSQPQHFTCPIKSHGRSRLSEGGVYTRCAVREAFIGYLSQIPSSKPYTCLRRAYCPRTWLGWKVFKGKICLGMEDWGQSVEDIEYKAQISFKNP